MKKSFLLLGLVLGLVVSAALAFEGFLYVRDHNTMRHHDAEAKAAAPCFVGSNWSNVIFNPSGAPSLAITGGTGAGYYANYLGSEAKQVADSLTSCLATHGFIMNPDNDHTVDYFNSNTSAHPGAPAAKPAPGDIWQFSGKTTDGYVGGDVEPHPVDGTLRVHFSVSFQN